MSESGQRLAPGTVSLQLLEESADVSRRVVPGQTVRIATTTRLCDRLIEEPLGRETVEIERIAVGRVVQATPEVRQEGDVTILPLMEEVLVLERRLVLKEEIRIRRVRTTEVHRETIQLCQQTATVTRVDADAAAAADTAPSDDQPARKDSASKE